MLLPGCHADAGDVLELLREFNKYPCELLVMLTFSLA